MTLQENMQKVAKAILGERPDVVMDLRDLKCSAYVAVAIIAHNECEALEYALELKAELINLWPAWRGFGIEYDLTRHIK